MRLYIEVIDRSDREVITRLELTKLTEKGRKYVEDDLKERRSNKLYIIQRVESKIELETALNLRR